MIKELLLSLAVVAASGVSFVGSPKKVQNPGYSGEYSLTLRYDGDDYYVQEIQSPVNPDYENRLVWDNLEAGQRFRPNSSDRYDLDTDGFMTLILNGYSDPFVLYITDDAFTDYENIEMTEGTLDGSQVPPIYIISSNWEQITGASGVYEAAISFRYKDPSYRLNKTFVNCDIASSPRLPNEYTADSQLSYYVLMVSNAGGYGFTAQSVTQTGGITIRNFNLFDQYNNSGYYASCSFNVDLPLNNCSLSVTAFLPQYTITSTLEHCTVSPAIPSSYTGTSFSGVYTFTAVSGYGFNENYTHWEVSNLFIDSVEFSSLLWGSFYSSVTLHLRASGGNSSISVTAIKYDEESYKLGYKEGREDGWQAGYDRGHADGEIAGNSYGVWNWLKQAALTTGEFLSINLLPGFSIGGLLTALAGLVIIWFFIKGFLFKS